MTKYFGTDGIREKAERFNTEFVQAIAKGLTEGENVKVLIGGDTRESSEWILRDFERSFETLGVEYENVGVLPTPAINDVFYELGFDYAIDVTASHNPASDNGIKIFERGEKYGIKLQEEKREHIERAIDDNIKYELVATEIDEDLHDDAVDCYVNHLIEYLGNADFSGFKIGLDCANGAMSVIGGMVFEKFGAEVVLINADREYGCKINDNCGSTHPEQLQKLVTDQGLDFGAAFDGDGDRCILVDNNGELVDGDQIIAILTKHLNLTGAVTTVMANQGLLEWAKNNDIELKTTAVGDQYVAAEMRTSGIEIGGEQSGHIILPNKSMGDGMLTALMVTQAVTKSGKKMSELANVIQRFPQVLLNMPASDEEKEMLKSNKDIQRILDRYNKILSEKNGRMLVRPSGTEKLVRVTLWGRDEIEIRGFAEEIVKELKQSMEKLNGN